MTRFGVDGWATAEPKAVGNENFNDWVDLDGSNNLTMRRAFGTGFDQPVARMTSGGTVNWYLTDYQGSVRLVIDNSDTVVATTVYSANGVLTSGSLSDRYGYTGMQLDSLLGLYYDDPGCSTSTPGDS